MSSPKPCTASTATRVKRPSSTGAWSTTSPSSSAVAATAPRTSGRPQIRVTSPPRPPSARHSPITSSLRSIFHSRLSSAVTSVKSALARRSAARPPRRAHEGDVAEVLDQTGPAACCPSSGSPPPVGSVPGRARDVDAAAPAALGKPPDGLGVKRRAGLAGVGLAGLRERLRQPLRPVAVGPSSWAESATKRG